jgi:hypothetical protein
MFRAQGARFSLFATCRRLAGEFRLLRALPEHATGTTDHEAETYVNSKSLRNSSSLAQPVAPRNEYTFALCYPALLSGLLFSRLAI